MEVKIQNLDVAATVLRFTPLELNAMGEWDTPREFSQFVSLSYLFPLGYSAGEVELQEGSCLSAAIKMTKSCRAFDGGGVVHSIVRDRTGGKKAKLCPWGKVPQGPGGEAVAIPVPQVARELVAVKHK